MNLPSTRLALSCILIYDLNIVFNTVRTYGVEGNFEYEPMLPQGRCPKSIDFYADFNVTLSEAKGLNSCDRFFAVLRMTFWAKPFRR
jgi:hypothetical protein